MPSRHPAVTPVQPPSAAGKLTGRWSPRPGWRSWTLAPLLLVAFFAFAPGVAFAARLRAFEKSLGSTGSAAGQMLLRAAAEGVAGSGVAVNETTHDIYVADTGNHRVDEFNPTKPPAEQFVRAWGYGVTNGKPELQVCTTTCQAGLSGSAPGELEAPALITVDNSAGASKGDIYIADTGDNIVTKFTATGALVKAWGVNGQLAGVTSTGSATLTEESTTIEALITGANSYFTVGEEIEGEGIPAGTTITGNPGGGIIEISNPVEAGKSGISIPLTAHRTFAPLAGITTNPTTSTLSILNTTKTLFELNENSNLQNPELEVEGRDEPRGLANDTLSGGLFKVNGNQRVAEFVGAGSPVAVSELVFASAFAADAEDLFVAEPGVVKVLGLSGLGEVVEPAGEVFGSETLVDSAGVAVDTTASSVFVSDSGTGKVDVFAPEALAAPRVTGESVSAVTDDSASFSAEIDPESLPGEEASEYRFQYGVCTTSTTCATSEYEATTPPATVPAGFEMDTVSLSEPVQGLHPGATYHYRVLARNGHGASESQEATFVTAGTGEFVLPDGREWELVSPPNKQGSLIEGLDDPANAGPDGAVTQAAADGHAITYLTDAPTETSPAGSDNLVQVLSTREDGGWQSRDLTIPHSAPTAGTVGNGQEYRFFSEDLSQAAVQPFGAFTPCENAQKQPQPCISQAASEATAFVENTQNSVFTPLVTACPASGECRPPVEELADVPPGTMFGSNGGCPADAPCGPGFFGASPDMKHVVLTAGALTGVAPGLFEWSAEAPPAHRLALVSLLPPNGAGKVLPATGEVTLSNDKAPGKGANLRREVSVDGSRVIWEAEEGAGWHLYMRVNATEPQSATVGEVCTEPSRACTLEIGGTGAEYEDANADASRVFFSGQECEVRPNETTGVLECTLVAGDGTVIGASEDGSYVYFKSAAVLTGGEANEHGEVAVAGQPNLYVRHGGGTSLVAVVSGADSPDWGSAGALTNMTARVSPDGRWFAFMSERRLTGYDNADAVSGQPDEEVFLYHAPVDLSGEPGGLVCASCNPTGARPHGVEYGIEGSEALESSPLSAGYLVWPGSVWLAGNVPSWTPFELDHSAYQSRYLSDGGRLFFNSSDGLVGKDIDGVGDVYEWEPAGIESPEGKVECSPSSSSGSDVFEPEHAVTNGVQPAGCVALISSGTGSEESAFLDASETGGDVFFLTSSKLSSQDNDSLLDVYDAHECTAASPCAPQPASESPACKTEASCKPAPEPQPSIYGPPPSATFNGPGNLVPEGSKPAAKLTAAQLRAKHLKTALATCKKRFPHNKGKRTSCERTAHKKFGAKTSSHRSSRRK